MGGTNFDASSRELSPRQERITDRLLAQVGPGPATFFRNACMLLGERPPQAAATHLIAHLLREVESALRSVLEPPGTAAGVRTDKHRARIREVLKVLDIPEDDAVAVDWLGMTGEENPKSLGARAHREALEAPRPLDTEFRDFVDKMEQVLDVILERFEAEYYRIVDQLDDWLATATPTAATARQLRRTVPNNHATLQYFFSNAPAVWVGPLREAGFFSTPPPAELDAESGGVQFPPWPASAYLAKVAAENSDAVVEAALGIPTTDNSWVHRDLVEIALGVPADHSARLASKIIEGLESRFGVLVPQRAGSLLVHLCAAGHADRAMELATALLSRFRGEYGTSSHLDVYEFQMILREHVPALLAAAGVPAFTLLTSLLAEVVDEQAPRHATRPGWDGSTVWRPRIDGYEREAESDPRHALVNAVRDAAIQLIDVKQASTADVVALLESYDLLLLQRLSMYLLARYPDDASGLVAARLTDARLASNREIEREYLALARGAAPTLDNAPRRRLLALIDIGPQPAGEQPLDAANSTDAVVEPPSRERIATWQRDRLAAIQVVLPPEWDARYQALVAEHGPAPDPNMPAPEAFWSYVWDGPVTVGELAAMSTESLVEFLQTWQPPADDWRSFTPGALRGALSTAVKGDAARHSAQAASFIGLPADYVGAVINGLWQATTDGDTLDWSPIVELCTWIDQQAEDELDAGGGSGARLWRGARLDMLRLLMAGLNPEPNRISANDEAAIWSIIERSCGDPDPTPDAEADRLSIGHGLDSLARTTVRPQAVRAAIRFGQRLRRRSDDSNLDRVLALLEHHADRWRDPSSAVRCIYGELFADLAWMDSAWATRYTDAIFPLEADQSLLFDAAWGAYLGSTRLSDRTWELLSDRYAIAVDRVEPGAQNDEHEGTINHLGGHLLNRFWFGHLGLDDHDALLRRFYVKASNEVATWMMQTIGNSLGTQEPLDRALVARLMSLWEFRARAEVSASDRELAEFGAWFASAQFEEEWSLRQLLSTLSRAGRVQHEVQVLARVADLAPHHTQTCLTFVHNWIALQPTPWRLTQSLASIREILATGLAGSPTAIHTSKKIISVLFLHHSIDLRDLLRDGTSG